MTFLTTLAATVRARAKSPLTWILVACAVVRVVGLGWGLPASDGWDNDGIAPRDFLAGLIETFTPGHYFTYPPLHLLLLGLVTSPITAVALMRSATLGQEDVVAEILKVPYMTSMSYVARGISVAMSLGITYAVAKIAEAVHGRRAGYLAAAFAGSDLALTYYAHTTNLDVPYLFWSMFSLLALVRAIAENDARHFRAFGVCLVFAVATKDQAYALFLLSVPVALVLWMVLDGGARREASTHVRALLRASLLAAVLFALLDVVVINPTGFRARLQFLTGPASQDFAQYSSDLAGRVRVLRVALDHYLYVTPTVLVALVALGLALHASHVQSEQRGRWVAGLLPLLAALSFTFTFNCIARRVEHRFVLPQSLLLAVYGGLFMDRLLALSAPVLRAASQAVIAVGLGQQAFLALAVDSMLLTDPRYRAEAWLSENVTDGDAIETYGLNVYLPRFPAGAHVTRVGPEPPKRRNPMPGFEEVEDAFSHVASRNPKVIVVCEAWAWRYLNVPLGEQDGVITPPTQMRTFTDQDGTRFFRDLVAGRLGYRRAYASDFEPGPFPRVDIHGSTGRPLWIYERDPFLDVNRHGWQK
jgi:hypothetical protein